MSPSLPAFTLASLVLAAPLAAQAWQTHAQHVDRKLTRVIYFTESGSPGQYAIDYSPAAWRDAYDAQIEQLQGKRARLGKDFWTRLDTSMNLTIGGTKVAPGNYYLGIGRATNGDWKLVLFGPGAVRKVTGDAFLTEQLKTQALEAPLRYAKSEAKASALRIELKADPKEQGHATLTVQWGNHQLTAPIVATVPTPRAPKPSPPTQPGTGEPGTKPAEPKKDEPKKE